MVNFSICLFIVLFLYVCSFSYLFLFVHCFTFVFVHCYIHLFVHRFISYVCSSFYLFVSFFIYLFFHHFTLFVHRIIYLFVHHLTFLFVHVLISLEGGILTLKKTDMEGGMLSRYSQPRAHGRVCTSTIFRILTSITSDTSVLYFFSFFSDQPLQEIISINYKEKRRIDSIVVHYGKLRARGRSHDPPS